MVEGHRSASCAFRSEAKETSMPDPDIDPSNSYGTPEGPEAPAAAHVTEPPVDFPGRERPRTDDDEEVRALSKD